MQHLSSLQTQNSKEIINEVKEMLLCNTLEEHIIYNCKNMFLKYNCLDDIDIYINYYMENLKIDNKIFNYIVKTHLGGITVQYKISCQDWEIKLLDFNI
jgi:hypothetical protein